MISTDVTKKKIEQTLLSKACFPGWLLGQIKEFEEEEIKRPITKEAYDEILACLGLQNEKEKSLSNEREI